MITTLMFHRVYAKELPELGCFRQFLKQIKLWGTSCIPGQRLLKQTHGICLTFDDAYFDFYHYVFPLLKQYQMQAVLAVPTALIAEKIEMSADHRLALQYESCLDNHISNNPSLCSWEEIKEMVDSGLVIPASHSATHTALNKQSDWQREIVQSKKILEQKLRHPVNIFVYPYGRFDKVTHDFVCQNYQFAMRIGSAANFNWKHPKKLIYRINADKYWPHQEHPFKLSQKLHFGVRTLSNFIRGR